MSILVFCVHVDTCPISLHRSHTHTQTHTQTKFFRVWPRPSQMALGRLLSGWEVSLAAIADIRLPACFQAITARHMHSLSHHLLHARPRSLTHLHTTYTSRLPPTLLHTHQQTRQEQRRYGTTTVMNEIR